MTVNSILILDLIYELRIILNGLFKVNYFQRCTNVFLSRDLHFGHRMAIFKSLVRQQVLQLILISMADDLFLAQQKVFTYYPLMMNFQQNYIFTYPIITSFYHIQDNTFHHDHSGKIFDNSFKREEDLDLSLGEVLGETKKRQNRKITKNIIAPQTQQKMITDIQVNNNILPNFAQLLLSYVNRINKSGNKVFHIISKLNHSNSYSLKQFYSYHKLIREKIVKFKKREMIERLITYIDPSQLYFTIDKQIFYNNITRILLKDYLLEEGVSSILCSVKINSHKRMEHLKIRRYFYERLFKSSHY